MSEVFQQDLNAEPKQGHIFSMQLFMKEQCPTPDESTMTAVLQKHLGTVENFSSKDACTTFVAANYHAQYQDKVVSPFLMITPCCESKPETIDAFTRSQMWDCPEHEQILSECRYQVIATDVLSAALSASERSEMLMNYLEALVELYPSCEAVYFQTSGKMIPAEKIRRHNLPPEDRFLMFAVNVRYFRIEGTPDMLVDSLGMSTLFLPDLQYHFHGLDPNEVVNHAYNMLSYILANDCPIKNGDTIDGIENGEISMNVQWKCHFGESLIQPPREVIDICMNEFAAGGREYSEE